MICLVNTRLGNVFQEQQMKALCLCVLFNPGFRITDSAAGVALAVDAPAYEAQHD